MKSRGEKYPAGVLIAYYLTLAAFFVASFYPQYRVWGISWWAYFPLWVKFGLLALGAVAPFAADRLIDKLLAGRDDITSKTYRWLVGGFAVTMTALFYLLRARTHFLGDGYTLLSLLGSENPFIKPRNFGGTIFQYWLLKLIGENSEAGALLAYQIVSVGAGILFLAVAVWSGAKLVPHRLSRLLFVLSICTGGYMLMFFGYVENYALFAVVVLAFMIVSALIAARRINRWWIVVVQTAAVFFHIFGVALLPVTLYLIFVNTQARQIISGWGRRAKIQFCALIILALGLAFGYAYETSFFFRLSILPIWSNQFTVQGYTLFSFRHLCDYLNLILMLLPGVMISVLLLRQSQWKSGLFVSRSIPILLTVAGCCGAAFIFSPGLGMPRDWDLFSLMGVALSAAFAIVIFATEQKRLPLRAGFLVPILGLSLLLVRAVAIANPSIMTKHILTYVHHDPYKSSSTLFLLSKFLRESRHLEEEEAVNSLWRTIDPEGAIIAAYTVRLEPSDSAHFEQVLRLAIRRNPSNWHAWADLGVFQYQKGEYDTALYSLHVADGYNPYNTHINYNIALCNFRLHAFEEAERRLLSAIKQDSSTISHHALLAAVYRKWGRHVEYMNTFRQIAMREDAPPEYVRGWIEYLVGQGQVKEVEHYLAKAIGSVLDSSDIVELKRRASQFEQKDQRTDETAYLAEADPIAGIPNIDKSVTLQSDSTLWDDAVRQAVAKNPTSWVAWGNLGVVYLRKDDFDSARTVLEIAVSINPISSVNYSNLAFAHFYLGDYFSAEASWLRARGLDSSSLYPIVGLAKLYQKTNQQDKYLQYFMKVVSRPDAPGDYLKVMGDYYVMQKRWNEAAETYARAVRNGYKARLLDSIYAQYPQLRRES